MSINPNTKREYWWVTNISKGIVGIGDLPLIPTLNPGAKADLLRYYKREQISQSEVLQSK